MKWTRESIVEVILACKREMPQGPYTGAEAAELAREHRTRQLKSLVGADLGGLDLSNLEAGEVSFADCNLRGADLRGAVFSASELAGADLTGAKTDETFSWPGHLHGAIVPGQTLDGDFREADLSTAKLQNCKLDRSDFYAAQLDGADMSGCTASETSFVNATMLGANLAGMTGVRPNFECANLEGADLSSVEFFRPGFEEAKLNGAKCRNARLDRAICLYADLSSSDLSKAQMPSAEITGADFTDADLTGAEMTWLRQTDYDEPVLFDGAKLVGANFSGSNLRNATFLGATVTNANFSKANLCGAVFRLDRHTPTGDFSARDETEDDAEGQVDEANPSSQLWVDDPMFGGSGADDEVNIFGGQFEHPQAEPDSRPLASDMQTATWTGAVYDALTAWPEGFDPAEHGLILEAEASTDDMAVDDTRVDGDEVNPSSDVMFPAEMLPGSGINAETGNS
jgi:uncharacterized protein YjbI with pentapeptide repeats